MEEHSQSPIFHKVKIIKREKNCSNPSKLQLLETFAFNKINAFLEKGKGKHKWESMRISNQCQEKSSGKNQWIVDFGLNKLYIIIKATLINLILD